MRRPNLFCSALFLLLLAATFGISPDTAMAEPALDRVLSGVQVSNQKQCTVLSIGFNFRIRYLSHFPLSSGQELRISLRPIDPSQAAREILSRRESLRAPDVRFGHVRAIDFEAGNAAEPVLSILFDKPANYRVSQGPDFQSLVVELFGNKGPSKCSTELAASGGGWSTSVVSGEPASPGRSSIASVRAGRSSAGSASEVQSREAAGLLDEGRGALRKGNHDAAISTFKKILKLPENPSTAEAQELLGLAYQRGKNLGAAQAEYEDYLHRYPNGEGAERVRQRLAGVATASGSNGEAQLKKPKSMQGPEGDGIQTWTLSGSASQFYIRDDSFRTLRDPSLPPTVNEDLDLHDVHRNEILTSLDAVATWSGDGVKNKLRFSGTEEHEFGEEGGDIAGVSALFLDTAVRDWGIQARLGRQTRNTGGVLGRFDGAALSFDAAQAIRINGIVGSPVLRRRDVPYEDEKLFYGASVDFGPFDGFDVSLFAIEQRDRDILDRQAVGTELRYIDSEKSAFATLDYDIHYQELNAAVLTGSWTLADKSTFHGAFDYRKSPYLSTWTAIQGDVYPSLYQMLKSKTLAEVEELALDRTASFTSASAGFSRPINDTVQVSFDATVTNFSGTPASGGLPATEGTGNEYFYAAQVIGNSVFEKDDLFIAGLRFADLDRSNYYVVDLSARYPLWEDLKVSPRLMLGYRTGDVSDLVEYSVLPSVLFDYYLTRDLSLELEAGARLTETKENGIEETSTDLFLTVGYRYDFYADGNVTSPSRAAPYGIGAKP